MCLIWFKNEDQILTSYFKLFRFFIQILTIKRLIIDPMKTASDEQELAFGATSQI